VTPRFLLWLVIVVASVPVRAGAQQPTPRVLVMPFENVSRDGRILWLSEASAVLLADELNALGIDAIARQERVAALDRLQVPPAVPLTDATVFRIGQLVGASHVVIGALRLEADALVVDARSIDLDAGRLARRGSARGPITTLFEIFDSLARQVGGASPASRNEVDRERLPVAAFENYIKGLLAETPAIAIAYLNAALQASPAFSRPRLALWAVYAEQDDHERALAAVLQVPGNALRGRQARFLVGLSQLALGQYGAAYGTFRVLADADPTANVLNNLGVVQLRRGGAPETPSATEYFAKAAETDSSAPDYYFNSGYAYWLVRDLRSAVYWLREAVRRNPADADAHFVLAAALEASGSATEARREFELAQRLSSTYEEMESGGAVTAVPTGLERVRDGVGVPGARRFESTLAVSDQRAQEDLALFHLDRGRRLFEQESDGEALAELERALFLSPYQPEAHLLIGQVHFRAGRFADAIDAFRISLWSTETATGHAALALALLEHGDEAEAREEAAKALSLDAGSDAALDVLSRLGATTTAPR